MRRPFSAIVTASSSRPDDTAISDAVRWGVITMAHRPSVGENQAMASVAWCRAPAGSMFAIAASANASWARLRAVRLPDSAASTSASSARRMDSSIMPA